MRIAQEHPVTKEKLLDAAQALMLAKGFVATTVDEICQAAEVTKGSFFHYFQTKEDLGKTLLERFCSASMEAMEELNKEKDPLKRVNNYVDFCIKLSSECKDTGGCLMGCFAQELSETHPEIGDLCAQGFKEWAKRVEGDLTEAKDLYAPKAQFDPKGLADHFIAIMEGSLILARAKKDKKVIKDNLEHFKKYLETLYRG